MIRVKHTITEEERNVLNRVVKLLGIRQKDLAARIGGGIEQNWISQTLSGKRKVRKVDDVERLSGALLGLFEKQLESQCIDADLGETLAITLKRLAYLSDPSKMPVAQLTTQSGRPVPANATNYVEREADIKLEECLKRNDFSIRVTGPIQSGRTTLLLKVNDEAAKKNFITDYFSVQDIIWNDISLMKFEAHKKTDTFFQWLKQRLANHWRLRYTTEDQKIDFASWLAKQLRPDPLRKFLLVVDDLTELETNVTENILTQFRSVKTLVSSLSIAIGLSQVGRSDLTSSMFFLERIKVDWFDEKQLGDLAKKLDKGYLYEKKIAKDGTYLDLLFERYKGQPLLSHFVIANITKLDSKADFLKQCKEFEEESVYFRVHKRLIEKYFISAMKMLPLDDRQALSDGKSLLAELQGNRYVVKNLNLDKSVVRNLANYPDPQKLVFRNEWYKEIADEVVRERKNEKGAESETERAA